MNNLQQDASPAKADVQVVMLDTERYQELLEAENFLNCLYTVGVDNWEWFDDAVKMHNGEII